MKNQVEMVPILVLRLVLSSLLTASGFGVSVSDAADYATRKMAVLGVVNEAGLNIRGEVLLNGERIREALLAEDGFASI
jgi:hypothetical protein